MAANRWRANCKKGEKMGIVTSILKWLLGLTGLTAAAVAAWFYIAPPDLIRVGAGYCAKIVCSNVFIAGRDAQDVLKADVQAPGHPLLKLMSVHVDRQAGTVRAGLFGLLGKGLAIHRQGLGCAAVPDGDLEAAIAAAPNPPSPDNRGRRPQGERIERSHDPEVTAILDDPIMTGPGMRAVVVVHDGRIVGERYGEGFGVDTPLLGWSMTKSVTAAIIGTLVAEGTLAVDRRDLFDEWKNGDRGRVSLEDLMAMSSGLAFNEDYGEVADVTRMLYLAPDMARFASAKSLSADPGTAFSYSSGTTVMLSRIWQNAVGNQKAALAWPRQALFDRIGMTSAVLEADARGTFVGSSYLYASARDWARFGQFLLQKGVWNGERILPEGYVEWMREPAPASNAMYGRGHVWLHGPAAGTPPGGHPDAGFDLPEDAFWFLGHDGQSTAVIPSRNLVVVRLGLTPSRLGYKPQRMVAALAKAAE
jgi:CubicO group peptidase (beta-lactamase class C family)